MILHLQKLSSSSSEDFELQLQHHQPGSLAPTDSRFFSSWKKLFQSVGQTFQLMADPYRTSRKPISYHTPQKKNAHPLVFPHLLHMFVPLVTPPKKKNDVP